MGVRTIKCADDIKEDFAFIDKENAVKDITASKLDHLSKRKNSFAVPPMEVVKNAG